MGREVRKVPANWQHPKNNEGFFIPLYKNDGQFEKDCKGWNRGFEKWQQGLLRSHSGKKWQRIDDKFKGWEFSDYAGPQPKSDDYMPEWTEEECTHLMMYETTLIGVPISPAFETPEKLARWLADKRVPWFGSSAATYEEWLLICKSSITHD